MSIKLTSLGSFSSTPSVERLTSSYATSKGSVRQVISTSSASKRESLKWIISNSISQVCGTACKRTAYSNSDSKAEGTGNIKRNYAWRSLLKNLGWGVFIIARAKNDHDFSQWHYSSFRSRAADLLQHLSPCTEGISLNHLSSQAHIHNSNPAFQVF